MNSRANFPRSLLILAALAVGVILPLRLAFAAPPGITAGEVLAEVNALRRSQGLEPYIVDTGITAYAQEHSEYQARIDQSTHLHSDGLTSLASRGYLENVAGGDVGYLTAQAVVYEIWADPVHGKTMVGCASGWAGVGVASNSAATFVTLNVLPGDRAGATLPGGTPAPDRPLTPIALVPLRTATMKPSGAVIHEVGYGQSLWAIALAYGVSEARIRQLNNITPSDSAIWAGQRLLIIPAGLVTPTPAGSRPDVTAIRSTAGLTPLAARISPSPTPTRPAMQAGSATLTAAASIPAPPIQIDPVFAGLIGLAGLGLILLFSSGVKINWRR